MTFKVAAAYIRVSTEDQVEYSPDAQLVEIRKYAAAHGYTLPNEFIFVDEGISGKHTGKRQGFQQMIGLAKAKPKPFEAILLWKFSRFARNREDSIVYKSMLRRQLGIDVISITEPVGDDKMSVIIEAMIEAMDEYYSINLAEEVKRGMTEKARRGGLQNTPPFGYRVEENILVPIPEETALVRSLFQRFIDGDGLYPLAKWLNSLGITTHRGGAFENRTIEYMLRNPVYIGKLRWNPTGRTSRNFTDENIILSDAQHKSIISQEMWDAAQTQMARVKAQHKYHGRPLSENRDWVTGLVRCNSCNSTLVFSKPHYWKCNGYVRGSCNTSQHITDEKLKDMILTRMAYDTDGTPPLSYSIVRTKPEQVDEVALFQEQKKQITAKLIRLREAYLAGVEDLNSYRAAKIILEKQSVSLEQRLEVVSKPQDIKKTDVILLENIYHCISILQNPNHPLDAKKKAAHEVIEKCIFDKNSNRLQIYYRLFIPES